MKTRKVLMIAFHFPPFRGSSGIQRTLRFARYLPDFGWEPRILTAHPRAYDATDAAADSLPPDIAVERAFALDSARHLAIGNRYPTFVSLPDRWASWWWGAVPAGLGIVRRWKPDALWSTYPIATAHKIGHTLARLTRLPWIADFRDPMAQDGYPADPRTWRSFATIESRSIARARKSVFTTPGAARTYRLRYPRHADRVAVIENGYDEEAFEGLAATPHERPGEPLVLLHSGIVYPSERDPTALFKALALLKRKADFAPGSLRLRFRAAVHEALLRDLAARFDVGELVDVAPPVTYREALAEMLDADGLVVLQASNCNEQIPAKTYEYLRAGKPILGLADPAGDTARLLDGAGVAHIAPLEDANAIAATLERYLGDHRAGRLRAPDARVAQRASRRERTADLARLLDEVIERA